MPVKQGEVGTTGPTAPQLQSSFSVALSRPNSVSLPPFGDDIVCIALLDVSNIKKKDTSTLLFGVLSNARSLTISSLFYQPIIRIDLITKGYIR